MLQTVTDELATVYAGQNAPQTAVAATPDEVGKRYAAAWAAEHPIQNGIPLWSALNRYGAYNYGYKLVENARPPMKP